MDIYSKSGIKLFGIGLSRTGTTSCYQLINDLGIPSCHLPTSFDEIGKFVFSNDTSVSARFKELYQKYPSSKFIYTTRNIDEWLVSCFKWLKIPSRLKWFQNLSDDNAREWINAGDQKLFGKNFYELPYITKSELAEAYLKHDASIRAFFSSRESALLSIDITRQEEKPVSKIINFLEENNFIRMPRANGSS